MCYLSLLIGGRIPPSTAAEVDTTEVIYYFESAVSCHCFILAKPFWSKQLDLPPNRAEIYDGDETDLDLKATSWRWGNVRIWPCLWWSLCWTSFYPEEWSGDKKAEINETDGNASN